MCHHVLASWQLYLMYWTLFWHAWFFLKKIYPALLQNLLCSHLTLRLCSSRFSLPSAGIADGSHHGSSVSPFYIAVYSASPPPPLCSILSSMKTVSLYGALVLRLLSSQWSPSFCPEKVRRDWTCIVVHTWCSSPWKGETGGSGV